MAKVYTEIVIDMESGDVLSESFYDYEGSWALADFGGGGGADSSGASQAAAQVAALQREMYNQTRNDLAKYRQVGEYTTPYYSSLLGINLPGYDQVDPTETLRATPGYNWMLNQGVNAIDRSAAARGMLGSGNVAKALTQYGQGLADQTYNNYMNRLYGLIGTGQNAAAQTGQAGQSMANATSNALMQAGQAQDQAALYNSRNQGTGWNTLASGLGLLGGLALSPMPTGGFGGTMLGSMIRGTSV